jgi:lipopolysaccharide/colanic/teichoic acid biosynthesis glycosyltransferase
MIGQVIDSASRVLRELKTRNIPFVMVTNGGGVMESQKAASFTSKFGVEILPEQVRTFIIFLLSMIIIIIIIVVVVIIILLSSLSPIFFELSDHPSSYTHEEVDRETQK